MTQDYRPLKVEMRNLNISEQSKEKILETLKYLHGEEFRHKNKSSYRDKGFRLDRQYWIDRGELIVQGTVNYSRNRESISTQDRINQFAKARLEKYGFHPNHCSEALTITSGDVGSAYELLLCRYFNLHLPDAKEVPANILEERTQELDSLRSIYDSGCEEIIANQIWHIHLELPYLAELYEEKKAVKLDRRGKKIDKETCRFYFKGNCRFAEKCRFSHNAPSKDKPIVINEHKNKFILEVRFPIGCHYPLEPPLVSLTTKSSEFPTYSCLRITKLLLDEASRNSELQQPCVFSLIDLLTNRQEEIINLLNGRAPVFFDPWKFILPKDGVETRQEYLEEYNDGDHLYTSAADKKYTRDSTFVNRIDAELCSKYIEKTNNPKYLSMLTFRRSLPAFNKMTEIIEAVRNNQVVIISGETGCGKSTQVPQFLLDDWLINRKDGEHFEIICTQPRKISAIGVSERVAAERAERIGDTVGYQIRLESKMSQYTRLLFCTTGILLRRLEREPLIDSITHVIIDEVHERSEESDFLLFILKDILYQRPTLKVILMSATLNAELFSGYFGGVPIIEIPGRTFPVEQFWLEDIINMTHYRLEEYSMYSRKIGKQNSRDLDSLDQECELADIQRRNLLAPDKKNRDEFLPICQFFYRYREFPRPVIKTLYLLDLDRINNDLIECALMWIIEGNHQYPMEGSILIFLPGIAEILSLRDALQAHPLFNPRNNKFHILPLHSMLTTEEQALVFRKPRPGYRKIVLSTNIAETSITIDDCVYVIDTGKMKEKGFDSNSNMESLETVWVSQANSLQRKGRAGRVMPGVCLHLYSKHRYDYVFSPQPVPEICRVPLEQLILRIKILPCLADKDLNQVIGGLLEPPDMKNVEGALIRLRDVGALDESFNLTPLGNHLAALPVDARIGKLILLGAMFCALDSTLTMAAFLSHKSPFVVPLSRREEANNRKKEFNTANSDQLTTLKAYKGWMKACEKGRNAGYNFANENCLSVKVLVSLIEIKVQLLEFLIDIGFVPGDIKIRHRKNDIQDRIHEVTGPALNANGENQKLLAALLCAALYPNIVQIQTPSKMYQAHISGNIPIDLGPEDIKFKTKADGYVHLHPTSVNHGVAFYPSPYLVYQEKIKTSKVFIRECTMVPVLALVLFSGGSLKVELNCGQFVVSIDEGWIMFTVESNEIAELLESIKKELLELLDQKIKEPRMNLQTHPKGKKIISTIIHLITNG
ncbi:putative ATP-dependent RNA helicase DHX57 isoform X2 [Halyomorpha halys]|uniref:putative ATP-dependent RNA helicase DHX57 isoform X2 n=1 Tax=Halyomorpha halys TaxID=286706 RepID=UPI0006D4C824|nr:putative ATP-dependent RNA helicase DHX57 [Halyomorpha halys]